MAISLPCQVEAGLDLIQMRYGKLRCSEKITRIHGLKNAAVAFMGLGSVKI